MKKEKTRSALSKQEETGYAEVTVAINEKKIAKVGKYPVEFITIVEHIAKIRGMELSKDTVDKKQEEHTLIYRTDCKTNPDAPYTAGFFAADVYFSQVQEYLDRLLLLDSEDGSVEDCITTFRGVDGKDTNINSASNMCKAIEIGLDAKALEKHYCKETGQRREQAYTDIKHFMEANGLADKWGIGYVSAKPEGKAWVAYIVTKLNQQFPWLKKCIKTMNVADVGEHIQLHFPED